MATFCIPKELTDKFIKALRAGKINVDQFSKMTPEIRKAFLADHFGKMGEDISKTFEENVVSKMKKKEYITDEEIQTISDMAKTIQDTKEKITEDMPDRSPEKLEYGTARAVFQEYVGKLKESNKNAKFYLKNPKEVLYKVGEITKSVLTSLDNSFFGRQGLKVLNTNPDIWIKNFAKSWKDIGKELIGQDAMIPIKADVLSRQNALNGEYKKGKYAVGVTSEEAYPSSLPEKIPLLGRLFKASETAFNGAALRMRADLADRFIENAKANGIDLTDVSQAESLGKLVNSMTGRGDIGKLDSFGRPINATFFSIRFLKSNFDTLTAHVFDPKMSSYGKKIAAQNLAKIVGTIGAIMTISNILQPGSATTDPRSSDFGKIKIGDTRFDITGGMASLVTLASRVIPSSHNGKWGFWTKSTTGKYTFLNSQTFGARTAMDVINDFWQGKLSPEAGVLRDIWVGQDYNFQPTSIKGELQNLTVPMPLADFQDLMNNPNSADLLGSMIMDELGFSTQTFNLKKKK